MCGASGGERPVIDADEERGEALEEGRGRCRLQEQQMGPDGKPRL